MLFNLKKRIINSKISERNKNHCFNYFDAENYSLAGINDPLINNSYYFSAHNKEMSIFCRLGLRCSVAETWFTIFYKGIVYTLKQELFSPNESPLKVNKNVDKWLISFKGTLNENDKVDFEASFNSKEDPLDFSSDMPSIRMAIAMANEKWKKEFFQDLDNIQGQTHYEQIGTLEGSFMLNDEKVDFNLACVRDHSFGKRVWDYMNNHLWLMAVSSSSQFNYSLVSYPVMSILEVGNYYNNKKQHYLLEADLDLNEVSKGIIPQELSLNVKLDDSRVIKVKAKVLETITYYFEDKKYILHENIAEYEIEGETLRGILEIGFNQNKARYLNGRKISKLKRK